MGPPTGAGTGVAEGSQRYLCTPVWVMPSGRQCAAIQASRGSAQVGGQHQVEPARAHVGLDLRQRRRRDRAGEPADGQRLLPAGVDEHRRHRGGLDGEQVRCALPRVLQQLDGARDPRGRAHEQQVVGFRLAGGLERRVKGTPVAQHQAGRGHGGDHGDGDQRASQGGGEYRVGPHRDRDQDHGDGRDADGDGDRDQPAGRLAVEPRARRRRPWSRRATTPRPTRQAGRGPVPGPGGSHAGAEDGGHGRGQRRGVVRVDGRGHRERRRPAAPASRPTARSRPAADRRGAGAAG